MRVLGACCRARIWQWLTYGAALENGVKIDDDFFEHALKEEMEQVKREVYSAASRATSRTRWRSPSRVSVRCRRWKARSVERWPIDTMLEFASRCCSSR